MATVLTYISIGCTILGSVVTAFLSGMTSRSEVEGAKAFDEMERERKGKGKKKDKDKPVYYYDWKEFK